MKAVDCTLARHGDAILQILNEAIVNSTALYDYAPRGAASMVTWFEEKEARGFPVLGVEDDQGALLGFATYGEFRARDAYKYCSELSLYVRHDVRGRGLGDALLGRLIEVAEQRDRHVLIAGIDATNAVSIRLHEKHGFVLAGLVKQCGYKFGRWLDLALYQRILRTPTAPTEG